MGGRRRRRRHASTAKRREGTTKGPRRNLRVRFGSLSQENTVHHTRSRTPFRLRDDGSYERQEGHRCGRHKRSKLCGECDCLTGRHESESFGSDFHQNPDCDRCCFYRPHTRTRSTVAPEERVYDYGCQEHEGPERIRCSSCARPSIRRTSTVDCLSGCRVTKRHHTSDGYCSTTPPEEYVSPMKRRRDADGGTERQVAVLLQAAGGYLNTSLQTHAPQIQLTIQPETQEAPSPFKQSTRELAVSTVVGVVEAVTHRAIVISTECRATFTDTADRCPNTSYREPTTEPRGVTLSLLPEQERTEGGHECLQEEEAQRPRTREHNTNLSQVLDMVKSLHL